MHALATGQPHYWAATSRTAQERGQATTSATAEGAPRGNGRPAEEYTLGGSAAEQQRLRQQLAVLRAHSTDLLDRVILPPGGSALDLGCGPAGILDLLSARAGPDGQVTGVDADAGHAGAARVFADQHGLANVHIVIADARHTGMPGSTFDLVHTRLVLANIARPGEVVTEMARLAKPGGWVAALEPDLLGLCYPSHPAVDRLTELFVAACRQEGADPHLGRRLPHLFRAAGLTGAGAGARTDVYPAGHPQRTVLLDLLQAMRPKLTARGLVSDGELDTLDAAARCHLADPDTLTMPVTYFLAWACKPRP